MVFWLRRMYGFVLCRSSDFGGVWLFRMHCRGAAFSASPGSAAPCFLSMYWGSGALFFFLGGSKGAVLDPPQALFFAVPELGFRWCLAVSHALPRSCVFGFSRLGCAMFFVYVLGLWGSFLLLRGFQRCRSGPAAGPVFCCAGARF